MGASTASQHHHRSTTKTHHRPFKSRHATKSAIRDAAKGKVEQNFGPNAKSRQQIVMSKIDRKHQARQQRLAKHREHIQSTIVFQGQKGAPRIVAVVPLTEDVDAVTAVQRLNACLDIDADTPQGIPSVVEVERFKQKIQYIPTSTDLFASLDACRVADFVVFVLSADEEVGAQGELLLKTIESQGVSNVHTVVQGLDTVEPIKKRTQVTTSLKSFITHFFPTQDKVHSLDSSQECLNIVRSICTATPKGIRWREERSWILADETSWIESTDPDQEAGILMIRGTVRGRGLNANRLLQIGDCGAFQIDKVVEAPTLRGRKRKVEDMKSEEEQSVLQTPDADQDDLDELAPEEATMDDVEGGMLSEGPTERKGVLLDDHHYFSDDEPQATSKPKKLPRGTSEYQAAWYLDDISDSGSDMESVDGDGGVEIGAPSARPEDGLEGLESATMAGVTEGSPSEYPQSEMFVDRSFEEEADDLAAFRKSKRTEAAEDLEFPDEIELHPNVLARERLARYRGLKSLRTSEWDTSEDKSHEPEEWNRLLRIADYRGAKSRALRETLVGGVQPGTRVDIYLRAVPQELKEQILSSRALTAFSLLRHESKRVVANYSMTLSSEFPEPVKSKAELIVQCGPRRFVINPLFSGVGTTPNNVHKFDRYLHPGRSCIATFIAPLTWGSVPVLFFQKVEPNDRPSSVACPVELIGTGTSQAPDQSRVVAKRVILTGHPYKIHKKIVNIRYMFFNKDDVRWFKALQLWTKRGRSGFIKESLGTHGYFKATFDAKINPQDSIGVSLYKRVFPRPAKGWSPTFEMAPKLVNTVETGEAMEE